MSSPEKPLENNSNEAANSNNENVSSPESSLNSETDNTTPVTDDVEKPEPVVAEAPESKADAVEHPTTTEDEKVPVSESSSEEEFSTDEEIHKDDDDEVAVEDLSTLSNEELVALAEKYADDDNILDLRPAFNQLREHLKSIFDNEQEDSLNTYLEDGGERDDYQPIPNPLVDRFYQALKKFNKRKDEFVKNREKELQQNLAKKKDILDELRINAEKEENIGRAFEKFRELQERWRAIGPVPYAEVRDLQLNYHFLNDLFYNHIEINRELQELDFRKNLEVKERLCEDAEKLVKEPSFNKAFSRLQELQQTWKETGPVPFEQKDSIWERFNAGRKALIEKRDQYRAAKEQLKEKNLELKTALCEKAEAIESSPEWKHKQWQTATEELMAIQKEWRKVGPAPDNVNDEIWKRFRAAADKLFSAKNNFYNTRKKEFADNLKLKVALCEQAENLMNSTDWKFTTAELIKLQKEWKKIGQVGERQSEKIWKRFRTACDTYFNNKSEHFADMDKANEENLIKKMAILEKLESFEHPANPQEVVNALRDFQQQWSDIGFVPLAKKEEVQGRYRKALDGHYDKLKLDSGEKQKLRYQQKLENIRSSDNPRKLNDEKRFLQNKINELQNDVQVLENNIGFFGHSKGAEEMKADFEKKIRKSKEEISMLKAKLKMVKDS